MIDAALTELYETLDRCFEAWNEGVRTGEPGPIAAYAAAVFNGTSGYAGQDRADRYDLAESNEGLPRLLGYVKGSSHSIGSRHVRMRSGEEGVASFEQAFERDGKLLLRFLYLQTWRKVEGKWLLVREAIEQLAR